MKILKMEITVDRLPDGCSSGCDGESCVFNQNKYCILKMALDHNDTFVQNNVNRIPLDCPLKKKRN